jgi:hypothetical protein
MKMHTKILEIQTKNKIKPKFLFGFPLLFSVSCTSIVNPNFFCILHLGDFLGNQLKLNEEKVIQVIFYDFLLKR